MILREKLLSAPDEKLNAISCISMKSPVTYLLVSIFLGELGVDRFMLGDIGMGILKLLTGGLCGIMWLIDIFTIMNKVKEQNFNNVMMLL